MAVRKLSVALDEDTATNAALAAQRHGLSMSAWLNAAAQRALHIEAGLHAVREWEDEHGHLTSEELGWADHVLDRSTSPRSAA